MVDMVVSMGRVGACSTRHLTLQVLRWIHMEDPTPVTCLDVAVWAEGGAR